jgi:hypothetical protein
MSRTAQERQALVKPCPGCGTTDYVHFLASAESDTYQYRAMPCPVNAHKVPLGDVVRILEARADMVERSGLDPAPYRNAVALVKYCLEAR